MWALNGCVTLVILATCLPVLNAYYDDEYPGRRGYPNSRGYSDADEEEDPHRYDGFPRGGYQQQHDPQDFFNNFGQNGRRFPQRVQDQEEEEEASPGGQQTQVILQKLVSQLKALKEEVKVKENENEELKTEAEEWHGKVRKLEGDLKTAKREKSELQKRLQTQSTEKAALEEKLKSKSADGDKDKSDLQAKVSSLEADKKKLESQLADKEKSRSELQVKVDSLEGEKRKLSDTATQMEAEKRKLSLTVTDLEAKVKTDQENSKACDDKSDPQAKSKCLEAEKKRLGDTVTQLRAKVSSLLAEASSKEADDYTAEKDLKNKVKSLEQNVSSKIAENKKLSATTEELHAQVRSLQAAASSKAADAQKSETELQSTVSSLRDEVSLKTAENENMTKAVKELSGDVSRCEAEVSSQKSENQDLSELVDSQRSTISSLNEQINETSREKTKEADELRVQISDTTAERAKIAEDLAEKSSKLSELNETLKSMDTRILDLTADVDSKASANSRLQEDFDRQSAEFSNLNGTFLSLKSQADLQLQQLEEKTAENSRLAEQVKSNEGTISNLQTDVQEKSQAHSQLQHKHHDLVKLHTALQTKHKNLEAQYEDPSVQHFLAAKAVKVYHDPGIEGAANKTFIYVLPTLRQRYNQSKTLLRVSEKAVYSKLNAYVGTEKVEPWLPAISGCLVYGTIVFPLLCTVCCLTKIVCKWRLILLFCHLDFLFTTLCAGIFAVVTGKEPLAAFAYHDASVYLFTQLLFAGIFCLYSVLLLLAYSCSKAGTAEGIYRFTQILGAVPVACMYYTHVWTPAMLDEVPHMDQLVMRMVGEGSMVSKYAWLPYLPVSFLFLILVRLERLSLQAAGAANSKNGDISVTMRDDIELANLSAIITDNLETTVKKE